MNFSGVIKISVKTFSKIKVNAMVKFDLRFFNHTKDQQKMPLRLDQT